MHKIVKVAIMLAVLGIPLYFVPPYLPLEPAMITILRWVAVGAIWCSLVGLILRALLGRPFKKK